MSIDININENGLLVIENNGDLIL